MFGFLKNKLKEWVDKAKEKIQPPEESVLEEKLEEKPEEKEEKVEEKKEHISKSKEIIEKETKPKKSKEKKPKAAEEKEIIEEKRKETIKEPKEEKKKEIKEKVIFESSSPKPLEDGTAIAIETELAEGVPMEQIDKDLVEKIVHKPSFTEKIKSFFIKKEEKIEPVEIEKKDEEKEEEKQQEPIPPEIEKQAHKPKKKEEQKEEEEVKEIEQIKEPVHKESFFTKLKSRFIYKITNDDFNSLFDDLEMLLLENNVALAVVEDMKRILQEKLIGKEIKKDELEKEIKKGLKSTIDELLIDPNDPLEEIRSKKDKPFIILFFGINGTGKTTSIAKLAHLLKTKGHSVVLAAGDTFRAASIEQISEHAKMLDVPLIKHDYGSDPAAVGFDAIKYAKANGIDVVLIDTAGRMHTKTNLLSEMEKIVRVTKPDLKIFVAESIAGNDATEQAKTFHDAIDIDGSILSKADIDEKGGTIISVSHATKRPIIYLGTGQKYEDIKLFNKEDYIKSLGLDE